jgi:hypothetical protein
MGRRRKMSSIKDELTQIFNEHNGRVPPEAVIEFARDENTALHSEFEWDDTEAAHQFRLEQARKIIRLNIEVIETPNGNVRMPVFVSLVSDRRGGGGYRALTDVMSNAEMRAQLLQQAIDELQRVRRKYESLRELAPVFAALDRVARNATRRRNRRAASA